RWHAIVRSVGVRVAHRGIGREWRVAAPGAAVACGASSSPVCQVGWSLDPAWKRRHPPGPGTPVARRFNRQPETAMQSIQTRSGSDTPLLIAVVGIGALIAYALSSPRRRAAVTAAGESALKAGSRLATTSADR